MDVPSKCTIVKARVGSVQARSHRMASNRDGGNAKRSV